MSRSPQKEISIFARMIRTLGLYILLLCTCVSCINKKQRAATRVLDVAEPLAATHPEAAYALLDSIDNLVIMDGKNLLRYCFLSGWLSDSIHTPLPHIDDLERAKYHLDRHGTLPEQIQMTIYYGRALAAEGLSEPASKVYLEALDKSLTLNNYSRAASICLALGDISWSMADYALSKEYYQQAASYFLQSGDKRAWGMTLKNIGREYAALDSFDLALTSMLRADSIIQLVGDSADLSIIYNGIGNIHAMQGEYDLAKPYFLQSIALDSTNAVPTYFALGSVYLEIDSLPQAAVCFHKAQGPTHNPDTHTELLYHYSLLEEKKGNIEEALSYMRQYVDSSEADIMKMKHTNLVGAKTQFDRRLLLKEKFHDHQTIKLFRRLFFGALLMASIIIGLYQHRINRKNKHIFQQAEELQVQKNNLRQQQMELKQLAQQLSEHQQWSTEQLQQKQQAYNEKEEEIARLRMQYDQQRKRLLTGSAIYKKIKKLATATKASDKELLTPKEWSAIYTLINDAVCPQLPNLLERANITQAEEQYCYLAFFGLDAKQEALLLHVSADTPHKYHTRIRRKLNLIDSGKSFYDHFMQL